MASMRRRRVDALNATPERSEAERRHLPDRLGHDRLRHLRAAHLAVDKGDRDLYHLEPRTERAVRRLDLERVPLRVNRIQVDRLEDQPPVALEPAGQITHLS